MKRFIFESFTKAGALLRSTFHPPRGTSQATPSAVGRRRLPAKSDRSLEMLSERYQSVIRALSSVGIE